MANSFSRGMSYLSRLRQSHYYQQNFNIDLNKAPLKVLAISIIIYNKRIFFKRVIWGGTTLNSKSIMIAMSANLIEHFKSLPRCAARKSLA
jgi:hypothetical protein